jgi:hypothetical protein
LTPREGYHRWAGPGNEAQGADQKSEKMESDKMGLVSAFVEEFRIQDRGVCRFS